MEAHGVVNLWNRSLGRHNLGYTTFIGDGVSCSFKAVVDSAPYGAIPIIKSDCIGHIQKRTGSALRILQSEPTCRDQRQKGHFGEGKTDSGGVQ